MSDAREAALTVLEKCRRQDAWSDAVLGPVLDDFSLSPRDRAFCSALCYGVMQNRIYLDFRIEAFVRGGLKKLEPKVLDILRLSACQILFMDKIPARAAVSEGVEMTKKLGYGRASGLVNAVLRKLADSASEKPGRGDMSELAYAALLYSHPLPLAREYEKRLGEKEAVELMKANNSVPPTYIRTNTLRISPEALYALFSENSICIKPHGFLDGCFEIEGGGNIEKLPGFNEGYFFVQDPAAAIAAAIAEPGSKKSILDACAAPGGKTIACAIEAPESSVLSRDLKKNKLVRIEKSLKRLGIDNVSLSAGDAGVYEEELSEKFDLVICDVPCSGLGVVRKKPDIRYKDIGEFERLPEIQKRILYNCSRYVAPGGTLLYTTCTVRREENEAVAGQFMNENPGFAPYDFSFGESIGSEDGMFTFFPHIHGTDGFFVCRMLRK